MDILEGFRKKAAGLGRTVVLPESHDERVVQAAARLLEEGICKVVLLGKPALPAPEGAQVIDPETSADLEEFARLYFEARKHKGVTLDQARETVKKPLFFAAAMVRTGAADLSVGGSASPTADVLRAGIHLVGLAEGTKIVSSMFLMVLPGGRPVTFADCAVVPNPDPEQLASIAVASAKTHEMLIGEKPLVAMLSFSTKGSASHEDVDKVLRALDLVREKAPALTVDGELQFDAAFDPSVGERKAPGSPVAGKANVFIFPDLDAANIGYKIAQRIGGAKAIGPVVQGFRRPFLDLSRGCSVQDIVDTAAIGCLVV
ncbi:MAG TPA: phosphate acetyltransferase [Planctomycetes bacterium]|nr:phosphate acetyltransferase [Planctomycetota bacterium]